jgi:hypothetical protein
MSSRGRTSGFTIFVVVVAPTLRIDLPRSLVLPVFLLLLLLPFLLLLLLLLLLLRLRNNRVVFILAIVLISI